MGFVNAFIFALLTLSGTVLAQDDAVPNFSYTDGTNSIVLTQAPCEGAVADLLIKEHVDSFKAATYTNPSGDMAACWFSPPASGVVLIVYADSDTSALPQHLFTPVTTKPAKGVYLQLNRSKVF